MQLSPHATAGSPRKPASACRSARQQLNFAMGNSISAANNLPTSYSKVREAISFWWGGWDWKSLSLQTLPGMRAVGIVQAASALWLERGG